MSSGILNGTRHATNENKQQKTTKMWMTKIDFHPYMVQIVVRDSETTILNTSWGILLFVFVMPEGTPL